jgi:excisionase family DNA binding protein
VWGGRELSLPIVYVLVSVWFGANLRSVLVGDTEYMSDELTNLADELVHKFAELTVQFPEITPQVIAGLHSFDFSTPGIVVDLEACDDSRNPSRDLVSVVESNDTAWTVPKLAKLLSLSARSLYDMIASGSLPAYKIGTVIRLCPASTAEWLRDRLTTPS